MKDVCLNTIGFTGDKYAAIRAFRESRQKILSCDIPVPCESFIDNGMPDTYLKNKSHELKPNIEKTFSLKNLFMKMFG